MQAQTNVYPVQTQVAEQATVVLIRTRVALIRRVNGDGNSTKGSRVVEIILRVICSVSRIATYRYVSNTQHCLSLESLRELHQFPRPFYTSYICYGPICNLARLKQAAHFIMGQPILKLQTFIWPILKLAMAGSLL